MMRLNLSKHSVSHVLLTRTADIQASNEDLPRLKRMLCDDYTIEEYCEFLQLLWAFHEGMELRLLEEKNVSLQQQFSGRCGAWKIETDLGQLGMPRNDPLVRRVWTIIPTLADYNERLGAAFVLEGNLLKGEPIRKALQRSLGPALVLKLHYHNEDVRTVEHTWRELVSLIDSFADNHARALSGAQATYRAVANLLKMAV